MGSHSDWEIMSHASATLDSLGIEHEVNAISAHRAPDALSNGLKIEIAEEVK